MKTINISENKFRSLEALDLSKNIFNTEGEVYNFNHNGKIKIFKRLFYSNGIIFANKLYTVEMLDTFKSYLPKSFICPDNLVSVGGEVAGFTTPKFNGVNFADLIKDKKVSEKEKLYYFRRIGEVLNQLKNIREYTPLTNIFINDLHEANILVNNDNKELGFIDLDSCKILNNGCFASKYLGPSDFVSDKPKKYHYNKDGNGYGYVVANENSDIYCYIIMILNYLYGGSITRMDLSEFYSYLNYLAKLGFNNELLECFNRISLHCDNINPFNYLDDITDEQVSRAKKLVYECNK